MKLWRLVISEPRKEVGKYAPKIRQITINPEKIGDVIGKQGKVINKIIEDTGVQIDIDDAGMVAVCGTDAAMIEKAIKTIETIVNDVRARPDSLPGKSCPHHELRCVC